MTGIGVDAVKSVATATTRRGSIPGRGNRLGHCLAQDVAIVVGNLQRPLGRKRGPGRGEHAIHDAVLVLVGGGAQLGAVVHPHHDGATRQRAEIDPDVHQSCSFILVGPLDRPLEQHEHEEDPAGDDRGHLRADAAVSGDQHVHQAQHERADHRPEQRPGPAGEQGAADDDRGDRIEFPPDPGDVLSAAETRGVDECRNAGQRAAR